MDNDITATPVADDDRMVQRLLRMLRTRGVLAFSDLRAALAHTDDQLLRAVLARLIEREIIMRRPHRRGVWYLGYALQDGAEQQRDDVALPPPSQRLLNELTW